MRYKWNHKRVYRVYCQLKLNIRSKRNKRLLRRFPYPLSIPSRLGKCWSMVFMSEGSENHRQLSTLNIIDNFNLETLGIDITISLSAGKITHYLDKLAQYLGDSLKIRVDNGAQFTSNRFASWAKSHTISVDYIKPVSPYQNGYIERCNRIYRTEASDIYIFKNPEQARKITEEWLEMSNTERPYEALNNMAPIKYKNLKQIA